MHVRAVVSSFVLLACVCNGKKSDIVNLLDKQQYNDCHDVLRSGRYKESGTYILYLNISQPVQVHCRFGALNTSSTVIMQQKYGKVSFLRGWRQYESGFGSLYVGDYWIGLSRMKALIESGYRFLTVTLQDWDYKIKVIHYKWFYLGPAEDRYRLHIGGYESSWELPDDFSFNNGMQFATVDRPDARRCAHHQGGGWWYHFCTFTLPTGHYYHTGGPYKPPGRFYDGIYYRDWHGYGYSLKYIKMELSRYY